MNNSGTCQGLSQWTTIYHEAAGKLPEPVQFLASRQMLPPTMYAQVRGLMQPSSRDRGAHAGIPSPPELTAMDPQYPAMPEGKTAVVSMPEEIDIANAGKLGADLTAACDGGVSLLIADMTGTTFCDASGVRMLVVAHKRAADRGIELRAAVASPRVRRILVLLGLDAIVPIYPTVDAAVKARQRRPARRPG